MFIKNRENKKIKKNKRMHAKRKFGNKQFIKIRNFKRNSYGDKFIEYRVYNQF